MSGGWFVVNARESRWLQGELGEYCNFEPEGERFEQVGVNLNRLAPGQPMAMYHREDAQEGFLVLAGECVLVVEGEERPLRAWDYVHCPPGAAHTIVGAGEGPSLVLAVGARGVSKVERDGLLYPVDPVAQRHGAGVETETSDPREAYARFGQQQWRPYEEGWLPS